MATIRTPKGRAPRPPKGERLTRSQIARRLGSSGRTVATYLDDYPDAPKADAAHRYSFAEVKAHIAQNSARLGNTPAMLKMKERLLALRVREAERAEASAAGRVVDASTIKPAITAFCANLTRDLQDTFEREIPAKIHGRTTAEIAELMAEGIDRVLKRLKAGAAPLTN